MVTSLIKDVACEDDLKGRARGKKSEVFRGQLEEFWNQAVMVMSRNRKIL